MMLSLFVILTAQDWSGTWKGTLTNLPGNGTPFTVAVTRELGSVPAKEGECTIFRTVYAATGKYPSMTKDYKLCLDKEGLFVDEGKGAPQLRSRFMGDVLVSVFRVGKQMLVSHMRLLRDGALLEEIFSIDSGNGTVDAAGVESLRMTSLQRLEFRRASAAPNSPH